MQYLIVVDVVGVILLGRQLDDVVGQPDVLDVCPELLPAPPRVGATALGGVGFRRLPGLVGQLPGGERAGTANVAAEIAIAGPEANLAVLARPLL